MRNTKGITLIALVITIIVLLILAGVSLSFIVGENGILGRATNAVDKNKDATAKEQVELLVADYQAQWYEAKYVNGTETRSQRDFLAEELNGATTNDYIVQSSEEEGETNVYVSDKSGNIVVSGVLKENGSIEWKEKIKGIVIGYSLEPKGYTNGDVMLRINASSTDGRITSVESTLTQNADGSYTITENGEYDFTVTDSSGKSKTRTIDIQTIDRTAPPAFVPTITDVTDKGFTIHANAVDDESGIGRYEYYVDGVKYESTEASYTIDRLEEGTEYTISVIVYDKAGNSSPQSEEIKQETKDEYVDYEAYIDSHMTVDEKIYISSKYGSDEAGNGTPNTPYATLTKITDAGIIENGKSYAVVLMNGEYELTKEIFELNCNEEINIFGNRGKTILNVGKINNGNGGESSTNYRVNFYRLVWRSKYLYANAIETNTNMKVYNVVFDLSNEVQYGYLVPQLQTTKYIVENCSSINKRLLLRCTSGSIQLTNCYGHFATGYDTDSTQWNYRTNFISQPPQVDENYRIIADESIWKGKGTGTNPDGTQANLGVYGGEYSWEN